MHPNRVNPRDWSEHEVIFNDLREGFSGVWGLFRGAPALGLRWDGDEEERGYPGQGAYPLWFVIPEYLTLSTLERLLTTSIERGLGFERNIMRAISEFLEVNNGEQIALEFDDQPDEDDEDNLESIFKEWMHNQLADLLLKVTQTAKSLTPMQKETLKALQQQLQEHRIHNSRITISSGIRYTNNEAVSADLEIFNGEVQLSEGGWTDPYGNGGDSFSHVVYPAENYPNEILDLSGDAFEMGAKQAAVAKWAENFLQYSESPSCNFLIDGEI